MEASHNIGNANLSVLMLPFLAHGHVSPLLELAKKLAEEGVQVYFCSTLIILSSISKKIPGKLSQSIELVEIHIPESPELPSNYHTTDGLPSHLHPVLYNSLKLLTPEIRNVVESLKPDLAIYDLSFGYSITNLQTISSVWFHVSSAASFSYLCHLIYNSDSEYPFPEIYYRDFELKKVLAAMGIETLVGLDEISKPSLPFPYLVNSCAAMEGKYMDHLANITTMKVLPVGPLIPKIPNDQSSDDDGDNDLINWLGQKNKHSTVFAGFGTMYFLSADEIEEIAFGFELSNVNFIWALRSPKGDEETRLEDILPEGFLDRVKDRGRIVRGWVPQARILSHPSVGGFLSHCGWISLTEGVEFGVPIIAMPMALEQPINGRVLVENGVAMEIVRDEGGKLQRKEIAKVIEKVVFEGAGETMRQKMNDLREKIKLEEEHNLDELLTFFTQLSKAKDSGLDANNISST